jgi:hypothetical protein
MNFQLYDYENEEYIIDPAINIQEIIKEINIIYFYEDDFVEVNEQTL